MITNTFECDILFILGDQIPLKKIWMQTDIWCSSYISNGEMLKNAPYINKFRDLTENWAQNDIQRTSMGFMSCPIEYTFLSFKCERLLEMCCLITAKRSTIAGPFYVYIDSFCYLCDSYYLCQHMSISVSLFSMMWKINLSTSFYTDTYLAVWTYSSRT